MKIPDGYAGIIFGRSSMMFKGIQTHVGLIDNDYILPIGVILVNLTTEEYVIEIDQLIAQFSFLKCDRMKFNEVQSLSLTDQSSDIDIGVDSDLETIPYTPDIDDIADVEIDSDAETIFYLPNLNLRNQIYRRRTKKRALKTLAKKEKKKIQRGFFWGLKNGQIMVNRLKEKA